MNFLDMDIKTITSLLFLGNLAQLVIMVFYRNIAGHRDPYRQFVAGKMLQATAWALLSLRGAIPVFLSAYTGNVMLFTGFALEVFALTTVGKERKYWAIVYGAIAGAGTLAFCIFGTTPSLWVGYSSLTVMSLFLTAAVTMLFADDSSPMRRIVGLFYGVDGLILIFRASNGFLADDAIALMSRNLVQTLTFSTTILLLIVSGIGFLLLFKEQTDRQLSESEQKYRTLVENANEAIVILQDGKIMFANEKGCKLHGLPLEQLIGRPFGDFAHRDDLKTVASYYLKRGETDDVPKTYTMRLLTHEGRPIWVLVSATLIEYNGKRATLVLLTNIDKLKSLEEERERIIEDLQQALAEVKTLHGLLPICASCKKIRNDEGSWQGLESYISQHSEAEFSHGICPECARALYPELYRGK